MTKAILIDAQFDVQNGQALVDMIKKSGKKLTTVYISAGDPDFYFGLEPVMAAFPDVKVLADQHVVDHINQTKGCQAELLEPDPGQGAPKSLTVPQVMTASHLTLDGEKIEIKEMNTPNAYLGPLHQDGVWRRAGLQQGTRLDGGQPDQSGPQQLGQGAGQPAGPETRGAWYRATSWAPRPRALPQ